MQGLLKQLFVIKGEPSIEEGVLGNKIVNIQGGSEFSKSVYEYEFKLPDLSTYPIWTVGAVEALGDQYDVGGKKATERHLYN